MDAELGTKLREEKFRYLAKDDMNDYYDYYHVDVSPVPLWLLILISIVSFWFQAIVTEERFVPALNVVSKHFNISDDVAGATIMAAGASSPELLACMLSIFVTHSALGMGTIVGSEIFNQLVIAVGAIFAARDNKLKLEPVVVIREVTFYGLALLFLIVATAERRYVGDDEIRHTYITWLDGLAMVSCYVAYVLICANYTKLMHLLKIDHYLADKSRVVYEYDAKLKKLVEKTEKPETGSSTARKVKALPFVRSISEVPETAVPNVLDKQRSTNTLGSIPQGAQALYSASGSGSYDLMRDFKNTNTKSGPSMFLVDHFAPGEGMDDIEDIVIDKEKGIFSCYLWKQSSFYDKTRIGVKGWHLRWFTFSGGRITSVDRRNKKRKRCIYPLFHSFQVEDDHLLIKIKSINQSRNCTFLSPSAKVHALVVKQCEEILERQSCHPDDITVFETDDEGDIMDEEEHHSLTEIDPHASRIGKFTFYSVYPLRGLIQVLVPDVRSHNHGSVLRSAYIAAGLSILFLILASFSLVYSLESIAHKLGIPEEIMGSTICAAGTSLPNYIASQVAARRGLGDMAISNAFGSNTWNILMGLGLPWFLYAATHGGAYDEMRDEGLTESMWTLVITLLVFIVLMLFTGFRLCLWHAYLFLGMYFAFVAVSIGQCFID